MRVSLVLAVHSSLLCADHYASARCGAGRRSAVTRRGGATDGAGGNAYDARGFSPKLGFCNRFHVLTLVSLRYVDLTPIETIA